MGPPIVVELSYGTIINNLLTPIAVHPEVYALQLRRSTWQQLVQVLWV